MQDTDEQDEEVLDDRPKSIILHLVKQLTNGQDLTRVLIPTFFLEPRSLLEKFSDLLAHPQLIMGVADEDDPLKRMLDVTRWYISGWHIRPKQCKKPYNPLLGEEFFCYWDHPDGSRSKYVAEQVSHHPPVSAVYLENRKRNLTINAQIWTRSKFLGNSAASINVGECVLSINNRKEEYAFNFPTAYACGLFIGRLRMELGGTQTITCKQSGYVAEIEFLTKPMFGGDYNRLKGVIRKDKTILYTFEGKWDSVITIKDFNGRQEVFFDVDKTPVQKKFVAKLEDQGPWESRKIWQNVTIALKKNPPDHDEATVHKTALEDAQRERKKEREEKGTVYQPKHFFMNKEEKWIYKKYNNSPYDPSEEKEEKEDGPEEEVEEDDDSGLPPGAKVVVEEHPPKHFTVKDPHGVAHPNQQQQQQPKPKPADKPAVGNILDI